MKLTVAEIAELTGAKISLPDSLTNMSEAEKYVIDGVDNLKNAQASQASVWKDAKYRRQFAETSAGVVFVSELQSDVAVLQLVHSHPGVAFAEFIQHLYTDQKPVKTEISPMASVSESATVGENVCIHAGAFVGENAVIGNGVTLHAGSFVGDGAVVGAGTVLHANSVLEYGCVTGTGCKLFAGAIVGGDGFGYVAEPPGQNATHPAGRVLKVPQIGNVVLGDRVEIGATSTVDRAAFGSTELGNDVKIDSRVQIAHNCKIGHCFFGDVRCRGLYNHWQMVLGRRRRTYQRPYRNHRWRSDCSNVSGGA